MRTSVDGSRIRNNKVAFSKSKGRYKLSRISFPLATHKGRQPQLYLRFETNCCDEKLAIYFTLLKL